MEKAPQKNTMGLVGMIIGIVALVFCWVPIFNWLLALAGLVFSIVGLFKQPKGMAIAGVICSGIALLLPFIILGSLL